MSTYSFRIRKGKYQLDLSTTDKELLVSQFELWVKKATEYNHKRKAKECKELVNTQIKAEEEITKKQIESQIAKHPTPESSTLENLTSESKKEKKVDEKNSNDKNLDIFYAPPAQETISSVVNKASGGVFDSILENSLNNPKTELTFKANPTIQKDNAFLNFINSS